MTPASHIASKKANDAVYMLGLVVVVVAVVVAAVAVEIARCCCLGLIMSSVCNCCRVSVFTRDPSLEWGVDGDGDGNGVEDDEDREDGRVWEV